MRAGPTTTRLSRFHAEHSWTLAELPVLARLSLSFMVTMLFGVPTCLVTHATEFPAPVPTAPFLDPNTALASPGPNATGVPPTRMIFIDPGPDPDAEIPEISFSVDLQSEDNGRPLSARVFMDWKIADNGQFGGGDELDPSSFDDIRTIRARLKLRPGTRGCHQVALVASHLFDNYTFQPVYPEDTGFVVWWLLIEHPGTEQYPAAQCPPGRDTAPADAGLEAAVR